MSATWKAIEALVGKYYSHNKDHARNPGSGVGAGLFPGDVPSVDFLIEVKRRQKHPLFERFFERCNWDGEGVVMPVADPVSGESVCIAELFPTALLLHGPEIERAVQAGERDYLLSEVAAYTKDMKLRVVPAEPLVVGAQVTGWWKETCVDADKVKLPPLMFLQEAGNRNNLLVIMRQTDAIGWERRALSGPGMM